MKPTKLFVLCFALLVSCFAMSQTAGTVKGKVTNDSTNKPLPNASIIIVGTKRGTTTDDQGNFTLKINDATKQYKIQVSHTGFASKEIVVKDGDNVTVKLIQSANEQEEVVVQTGLGGAIRKKELTGSVATTSAKDLKDIPINNVAEALNGRLTGVTATTAEGSPDAAIKVRVRGGGSITQSGDPLYIIDGVQVENGLNGVVLQDIQDITVLKDAATISVYGARGANGVIIITTKSGKIGEPKVVYNNFFGVKNITKTLDVMSPYEFILYGYERSLLNTADSASFRKDFGGFDTFGVYKTKSPVNWQKEILGRTGFTQMHNIGISGGTKKWNYNFGYTFNGDKAIVKNSDYLRHQINLKNEIKITDKLKTTIGMRLTNQQVFGAGVSDDRSTSYNRLRNTVKYRPYFNPGEDFYTEDPFVDDNPGNGLQLINPSRMVDAEYRKKATNQYNLTASLTYTFNKHWNFKSTFGYDRREITDKQFTDSSSSLSINYGSRQPVVQIDNFKRYSINNSNSLTYTLKNYKKRHDIEVIAGQETLEINNDERLTLSRYYPNFISKDSAFNNPNLGQSDPLYPKHNAYKSTQVSFFGVARYSLLKKYFLTFTYRADGSSKFQNENQWGYFKAGSLAWRVSDEKWFEKIKFINELKLRTAYGEVGNNRIDDYLYSTNFNNQTYIYGINGVPVTASTPLNLANTKIKWEASINYNVGFDLSVLNNKLNISFDYFTNKSRDLLLNVPIAATFGYATQIQNIGKTKSSGFEIQINATPIQRKNGLTWNSNFNISFAKNTIEALGTGMQSFNPLPSWGVNGPPPDYIAKIGAPVGSMVGYVQDGFYTTKDFNYDPITQEYALKAGIVSNANIIGTVQPGSIKYKDIDGNGVIDALNDRTIIGNPNPKFTGGFNNQFTYKNWDASIFLNFSVGNDVYNANRIEFTNGYIQRSNMLKEMEGRYKTVDDMGNKVIWTQGTGANIKVYGAAPTVLDNINKNATMWSPLLGGAGYQSHSWAIEDGSFLRINNITIGYSLPIKTLVKLGVSRIRIYATANNVALFTKYSGFDPEVGVRNNPLTPALDYSAYPRSRSFLFGLNVTF